MEIKFFFAANRSPNYKKLINLCKKIGNFTQNETNILVMTDNDIFSKWDTFNLIFNYIKKWSSFEIKIDGQLIIDQKIKSDFFYAVQDVRNCYLNYLRSRYKNEYCKSHWGCHKLKAISFDIYGLRKWFHYGRFISDTVWQIDKGALKDIMIDESKMRFLELCPCFDSLCIDKKLIDIPDEIDISLDNEWVIEYKKVFIKGKFESVPHSIRFQEDFSPAECKIIEVHPSEMTEDERSNMLIDEYNRKKKIK